MMKTRVDLKPAIPSPQKFQWVPAIKKQQIYEILGLGSQSA